VNRVKSIMLEFAKIVHEAIGIQSPRLFIAVFAVFGLLFFGGIGWLIDKGYRVKLQQAKSVEPTSVASPAPAPIEQPTFREKVENVTVSLGRGGISVSYTMRSLKNGPMRPFLFDKFAPIIMYVEDNKLYADVKVSGPSGESPIEIKHNEFTVRVPGWDKNSNQSALEVVNQQGFPVFQMIYRNNYEIEINGFISIPGSLVIAQEDGVRIISLKDLSSTKIPVSIKRIFKYPSWKYPGQIEP